MSTSGKATRNATSTAALASRASTPRRTPKAPKEAPARTSPSARSGRRLHGSPPSTSPTSATTPKTTARTRPSASATVAPSSTFAVDELAQADEPADEPPEDVLVALRRDRRGGQEHAHEGERQRERVGLNLRGEEPRAPGLALDLQLDRVRGRPKRLVRRLEREARLAHEVRELVDLLEHLGIVGAPAQLLEEPAGLLEPDDVELVAEEVGLAALDAAASRTRGSRRCRPPGADG